MKPIYLDYNATTPILPEVADAMRPFLENYFGNPSSSHIFGREVKKLLDIARKQIADLLSCTVNEIVFTSGGSESNNFAIKGIAFKNRKKGKHIITSSIEHPAVREVCTFLEQNGFEITYLPVDEFGIIDLDKLTDSIKENTILISIMHANNEVGTIQPISKIAEIAKKKNIIFHSDGAQSIGKIETNVYELGVDLFSLAGHKLYAPKGVGALYIKKGIELEKFIHGANHENNRRAGTENLMEIAGLGKACKLAKINLSKNKKHLKTMRDKLEHGLIKNLSDIKKDGKMIFKINGHPKLRIPNTLSISFLGIEANALLKKIENDLAVSGGAACHSDGIKISETLQAMHVPEEYAMGTIRLSTGKMTTAKEINKAIEVITKSVINN